MNPLIWIPAITLTSGNVKPIAQLSLILLLDTLIYIYIQVIFHCFLFLFFKKERKKNQFNL
jgi:hypothetical protein